VQKQKRRIVGRRGRNPEKMDGALKGVTEHREQWKSAG